MVKMMKQKTTIKISALITAAFFAVSSLLPCFVAAMSALDDKTYAITTIDDLSEFARKCKTDSWSRGKTFVLQADLDLSGMNFEPIPTFGGIFDGGEHTISGINMSKKGSYVGFFRYVQSGAEVKNLKLSGTVTPDGTKKYVGGIVGENSGTIRDSVFNGSVKGDTNVGGICGYITESGSALGCAFVGSVTGDSYTGGIAGQNFGTIDACTNKGKINTTDTETAKTIQDINIDTENLRSTENIDAATDTGGICGYSKGKITGCANRGDVGYKSVGYNTGGICGRQAGFISSCENYGEINGRKDVGGIVGQAEPYILLEYTKDILDELDSIFNRIKNITGDSFFDDGADSLDRINQKMSDMTDKAQTLSDDVKNYADDISSSVNTLSDNLNKMLDKSSSALNSVSKGTDDMSDAMTSFKNATDSLRTIVDKAKDAADNGNAVYDNLNNAASDLQEASKRLSYACREFEDIADDLQDGADKFRDALSKLSKALKAKNDIEGNIRNTENALYQLQKSYARAASALDDVANVIKDLKDKGYIKNLPDPDQIKQLAQCCKDIADAIKQMCDALVMMGEKFDMSSVKSGFKMLARGFDYLGSSVYYLKRAGEELKTALDKLDGVSDDADKAIEQMQKGFDSLSKGTDSLSDGVTKLADATKEFSDNNSLNIPSASDAFGGDFDGFFDTLREMQSEFTDLTEIMRRGKNSLSDDIDSVNDDLDSLSDLIRDTRDTNLKADENGFIEDISDMASAGDIRGKIAHNTNYATVHGDVNVGGIVGSMAIEYDFDPEDDAKASGDKTLNFTFKTKCVVMRCANRGEVDIKKNYGGGITGRMDLGSLIYCENYADVTASDGDYIGGIAGLSDTTIRSSAAKCSLSGKNYVGGIAGKASALYNNYTVVNIAGHEEFAGSVAGFADRKDLIGNFAVNSEIGAADGINYTDSADETDIDSFVSFVNSTFGTDVEFRLTFMCDDKQVGELTFNYREDIPDEKIPKVPEKKGYYGKWSEYDFSCATHDAVINAEYYREISLINTGANRDGKSVILVCGAFDDNASVKSAPTDNVPKKLHGRKINDSYDVKIHNVYTEKFTVRYLPMSDKAVNIYAEADGKLKKTNTKKFGSYLEFETASPTFSIYEVQKNYVPLICVIAVIIALAAAAFARMRRKLPHKEKTDNKKSDTEVI